MADPFRCTNCGNESSLKSAITDPKNTGRSVEIFDCAHCGQTDLRLIEPEPPAAADSPPKPPAENS
jgi:hypothetical protein